MDTNILDALKDVGLLSDQTTTFGYISTGSYALNRIISGNYKDGLPIGMISQFYGESSTAKTVFATHVLREAQKKDYYTVLLDSENAYNSKFAESLGIDPSKLIYLCPETIEDCFAKIEEVILAIRSQDTETPIVIAYDSLAVSPSKFELEAEDYDSNNMIGAMRAKVTGAALRKANGLMRKHKVALIIINQIRSKVGVLYGSPETMASGGKALDYYLGVNLKCISNKTSDKIMDEEFKDDTIGITGKVRNTKNKCSIPFKECEFELLFNKGLNKYAGLVDYFIKDRLVTRSGAWYTIVENGAKFQKKDFIKRMEDTEDTEFAPLRNLLDF